MMAVAVAAETLKPDFIAVATLPATLVEVVPRLLVEVVLQCWSAQAGQSGVGGNAWVGCCGYPSGGGGGWFGGGGGACYGGSGSGSTMRTQLNSNNNILKATKTEMDKSLSVL